MLVAGTVLGLPSTAEAKATRYRQGSANDVSRASWAAPPTP
ncbi:hypothetical protein ACFQ1I_03775 [Kitasatospora arboriphila]